MQPIKLEIFLDDKTLAGMKSVEGNVNVMEQELKATIVRLEKDLADMQVKMKQAMSQGVTSDKDLADIQALKGAVGELKEGLKALQKQKQQTNKTPIMANDPAPKLNHVKMSMAQIARELPAIAMGPQMFFLAISNNIPMFTDAIGNARKEYERLTAAGQKAMPVWKQVLKSLISWQTVMATAITLTVVYGKEIGEWFSSFSKGKKGIDVATESLKGFQKAITDGEKNAQKELAHLNLLYNAAINSAKSTDERRRAVLELKKEYPDYFGKLGEETILLGNAKTAYDQLSASILATAKARAAEDAISENSRKMIDLDNRRIGSLVKQTQAQNRLNREEERLNKLSKNPEAYDFQLATVDSARKQVKKYKEEVNDAVLQIELLKKTNERLAGGINVKDLLGNKKKDPSTPHDYATELSDARLRARQKIEAARIGVMVEGYEKRKAIAQKEYNDTMADIDKEERDTLAKLEKSKKAGKKVLPEETQKIQDDAELRRVLAYKKYTKEYTEIETDRMTQSIRAWVDYNKKYGTQQQKKVAIAQEYAMKIAKAETSQEKESLKRQMKEEFQALDFKNLKKEVNWEMVFGNLSALTGKQLQEVKRQLQAFRNSPEFKQTSSPQQIKIIEDAINSINTAMVDKGGLFGGLTNSMAEYKTAVDNVKEAQEELNKALERGDDAAIEKAKENLNNANNRKNSAQGNVDKSKDKAVENINFISDAMTKLSEGRASLAEMGKITEKLIDTLSESETKLGGIVGLVMSVFSSIAEKGIDGFIGGIVQSLGKTAEKAWGQLANTVTFGIFDIGGADYDDYNELAIQYSKLSAIWDELIDKKREYINESYGGEVSEVGKEALAIIAKAQQAQQALAQARAKAGSGTGAHSIAYRQNKNLNGYASELYKYVGQNGNYDDITNALLGASVEQLKDVQEKMPELWARLDDEFRGHLENMISGAEQTKQVMEQMKEQLTQVSFDSVHSSFIDSLMNMDSSAEDFAKNFEGYMQRAILSTMMGEKYKDRLRAWYDSFAKANDDQEGITKEEMDLSKEEWDAIVKDAIAERDKLKELFGWKGDSEASSQSGHAGTITTMTQEQGTKLEGLFTSLQDHVSAIHRLMEELRKGREADSELFVQIAENTAYCRLLEDIYELLERQDRDGVNVKMKG